MPRPQRITYHVVEVTDLLRNNAKSYKIYERIALGGIAPPVITGIATRAEAEAKARELEQMAAGAKR